MRTLLAGLFLGALVLSPLANAGESHVGLFKNVRGDVKVMRENTAVVAVAGTQIKRADVVISGPGASGGIVFRDGTLLTVGASSEIEISRYVFKPEQEQFDFSLFLRKGEAIYSSGKIGKLAPEAVSINTPRSTVGVRGTRFIVTVD